MGRGQRRRDSTDRLGIFFTDRSIVVAGVDLTSATPVVTWATTATVNHGAIIDGVVRDVRAVTQALMNAQIPHRSAVVAVPGDRRVSRDDPEAVHACALGESGVIEASVRRRTLARVEHVLDRSGVLGVGWVPDSFAQAAAEAATITDPEGLGDAGVDLVIPLGAALWVEPEPWPPTTEPATSQAGWRVARVG